MGHSSLDSGIGESEENYQEVSKGGIEGLIGIRSSHLGQGLVLDIDLGGYILLKAEEDLGSVLDGATIVLKDRKCW